MRLVSSMVPVLLLVLSSLPSWAEEIGTREQLVKTAFIYNFSKFVDWPEETEEISDTFSICVLGINPYGKALFRLEEKKIKGRDVVIQEIFEESELLNCRLAYIGLASDRSSIELVRRWQSQPILFVAASPEFARNGGGIGMYVEDDRVRFLVNEGAIRSHGLRVSSRLLDVASEVLK